MRLSVTDLCNYRCIYCMSDSGVEKLSHSDILSIEELTDIARASYELGINKIRLTGGEPLIRRGIVELCRNIRDISPEIELSMTTNGSLLKSMAAQLKDAGLDRLNISLDTLDPDKFRYITRRGKLSDVLSGIRSAMQAGFESTKINVVLMGGINDGEIAELIELTRDYDICVRFIELMPMGVVSGWEPERFLSCSAVGAMLKESQQIYTDGVATVYRPTGHKGSVGLITPMSDRFCDRCNKIRVTADGRLKPCLHSDTEIPLRDLGYEELKAAIKSGILAKPMSHELDTNTSGTHRCMNEIGG